MENLQSEIVFVAKFGGIVLTAFTHYFYVIKPIAIFNERQKQNKRDIEDLKKIKDEFITLKAEHEMKICNRKRAK